MSNQFKQSQLQQTALDFHRNGQFVQAESCYQQILATQPKNSDVLHLLGVLYHQTERHQQAIKFIAEAIQLAPRNADYLSNYGLALSAAGQPELAIENYQKALKITPQDWDVHLNLGNAYLELEHFEDAANCYRRVLRANPSYSEARDALGYALQALGSQCQQAGRYLQAEACYQETLQLSPNDSALHYNLGNAQRELGKASEALASYQRALKLSPNDADIHNNLGNVLRELGRLDEAIASYQTALRLNPTLYHAKVHLVHQKQHACDWAGLDDDIKQIRDWVKNQPQAQISPFAFLAMPGTTAIEQKKCVDNWLANRYSQLIASHKTTFTYTKKSSGKIRIGYLSGDFRLHPLASLISELIELHDRNQFEIFAYSYAPDDKTPERKRLEKAFDHFVDIRPFSLEDAAKRINTDQIDILVDLTGFTQTSRTGIVALKPAPVSVSWLGFPGTMGSIHAGSLHGKPLFDYLLSDATITPLERADYYAEQLALLPDCYQPNDSKRPIAATPSRADCGLPDEAFIFCCFNQSFKILPAQFNIWMRLLKQVPKSVLWLLECNTTAKQNLKREAEAHGINPDRLIFAPRVTMSQHLARHALADLFLDTLPYNAHTTASDALWMGLPILTCIGETFTARVAASILNAAKLPELITYSLHEYEVRALQLSNHASELKAIKQRLKENKQSLPLFNTANFAAHLEQLYQKMWQSSIANP